MFEYRPVVFTSGGEDGVCGGRHFQARPIAGGFRVTEGPGKEQAFVFNAANLGEIRDGIQALVNG